MFSSSKYLEYYEFTSIEPDKAITPQQGNTNQVNLDNVIEVTPFDWYADFMMCTLRSQICGGTLLATDTNVATPGSAFTLLKSLTVAFNGH